MGSFYEFVATLKDFLHIMFLKFPLIITGTLMILGLVTVNTAFLWVSFGSIVTFFGVFIIQLLFELLVTAKPDWAGAFTVPASNICNILTTTSTLTKTGNYIVTPSYWFAFLLFFITYTFRNALQIYNKPPGAQATADPDTLNNRMFQASLTMFILVILGLAFTIIRMVLNKNCETWLGAFLGSVGGATIGYYWFEALINCGEDRAFDLFGILGRIMPAATTEPQACIYNPDQ
jgi:hypothetical protein